MHNVAPRQIFVTECAADHSAPARESKALIGPRALMLEQTAKAFVLDTVWSEIYFTKSPATTCATRERQEPCLMSVQMELHKIIISEMQDQQIIVLKEVDGERKFPIVIGSPEAFAIDRRLKGHSTPRPMTHDLLANTIESMGG